MLTQRVSSDPDAWFQIRRIVQIKRHELSNFDYNQMILQACENEPLMIQFLDAEWQTENIIKQAVSRNGNCLRYVKRLITIEEIKRACDVAGIALAGFSRPDGLGYVDEGPYFNKTGAVMRSLALDLDKIPISSIREVVDLQKNYGISEREAVSVLNGVHSNYLVYSNSETLNASHLVELAWYVAMKKYSLKHVNVQTLKICHLACQNDSKNLRYVNPVFLC